MVSFGVGWLYSRKKPLSAIVHQLQMWFILLCYYLLLFIMLLFCINYFCQTAHSCMHRNLVQPWIHLQRGMKEEWKKMRDVEMSSKETQAWGKMKPFSGFPFIAKQHLVGWTRSFYMVINCFTHWIMWFTWLPCDLKTYTHLRCHQHVNESENTSRPQYMMESDGGSSKSTHESSYKATG